MTIQMWAVGCLSHGWNSSVPVRSAEPFSIEPRCPAIDPIAILLRYLYVARKRISRLFKQFFSRGSCNKNSKVHGMKRAAKNHDLL